MTTLNFTGFTQAGVEILDTYLSKRGMTRSDGTSGDVTGAGLEMKFNYDLTGGTLRLDLVTVPDGNSPEHIEFAVNAMLESGKPFGIAGRTAEKLGYNFPWG